MFNFKLSKPIGVFCCYTSGMNDCNEWKTEKRHECTNIVQLQTSRIFVATVADVGTMAAFTNFKAAWFLLDRLYKELKFVYFDMCPNLQIHRNCYVFRHW